MKQLIIKNCTECKHIIIAYLENGGIHCDLTKKETIVGMQIPSWCPLDDAPENAAMRKRAGNIEDLLDENPDENLSRW